MRDRLVDAVLREEKTATCSLLSHWLTVREELPTVGERQTVIDSDDHPVAVIEIVDVDIIRLADADLNLAVAEGEGFGSVDDWREAHEQFWVDDGSASPQRASRWRLDDDAKVVVEHFRVVERLPS